MGSSSNDNWQANDNFWLQLLLRNLPLAIFLAAAFGGMLFVYWFYSPVAEGTQVVTGALLEGEELSAAGLVSTPELLAQAEKDAAEDGQTRVGIISGHMGSDSGSVCPDGLTEAEVNLNIAEKIVRGLQARGIQADLLDEFDPRLDGYKAAALISIHADSCDYFNDNTSGFKIAGSLFTDSEPLFLCIEAAYQNSTQLAYHADTITPHMTNYHAFRKIDPSTQAIILETGFMNLDRELLTTQSDVPARGIMDGLLCFFESSQDEVGE